MEPVAHDAVDLKEFEDCAVESFAVGVARASVEPVGIVKQQGDLIEAVEEVVAGDLGRRSAMSIDPDSADR
ncbi:hypothetical protein [Marmoricola sp. RAF53]|uniref:hypothetical protein n=1 Tax=Marmoricola sp. RAF53 TaxID=3233059 RepID=UPI003F981677